MKHKGIKSWDTQIPRNLHQERLLTAEVIVESIRARCDRIEVFTRDLRGNKKVYVSYHDDITWSLIKAEDNWVILSYIPGVNELVDVDQCVDDTNMIKEGGK